MAALLRDPATPNGSGRLLLPGCAGRAEASHNRQSRKWKTRHPAM